MKYPFILIALTLTSCGNDHFKAGKWELTSSLGQVGTELKTPGEPLNITLTDQDVALPTEDVIFGKIYRGSEKPDIHASNGIISGVVHSPGMDDIRAQDIPVSGTFDSTHLHMTLTISHPGVEQTVDAHYVGP